IQAGQQELVDLARLADRAVQQRVEMRAVRPIETGALLDVRMDRPARLAREQPLVEALHGQLAGPATRAARPAARASARPRPSRPPALVLRLLFSRHLDSHLAFRSLASTLVFPERLDRRGEVGHLDGHPGRLGALLPGPGPGLLLGV